MPNLSLGVPEPYLTYLKDAADGINSFVYIKGYGDLSSLVDAAKHDELSVDVDMTISDDFPIVKYTVEGEIENLFGNPTTVKLILIVTNTLIDVTINQAVGQADPTNASSINFTVVFSEPVTGFQTGDVTITGSVSGVKTGTVTGSGTTYNVAVSGMISSGTIIASIPAGVAQDTDGNANAARTSTGNVVTFIMWYTLTVNKTGNGKEVVTSIP